MKRVTRVTAFYLGTVVVVMLLAFLIFPRSAVTAFALAPGLALAPVLGPIMPGGVIDRLVPEGGPGAAVLLFLVGACLAWGVIGGAIAELVAWRLRVRRRGAA